MSAKKKTTAFLRTTFKQSVYALWVILISLLVLELVLRTTHLFGAKLPWTKRDALIGYRFIPNHAYWYGDETDRPVTGRINKWGWRDVDWSLAKPANTYRVAVLGDSFVEAFQVDSDRTFLSVASKELTAKTRRPVEFMNFGRSGFTQSEEFLVLQRDVLRFRPDAVILLFYPQNDIDDISRETAEDGVRPFYHLTNDGRLTLDLSAMRIRHPVRTWLTDHLKQNSALAALVSEKWKKLRHRLAQKREAAENKATGHGSKLRDYLSLATHTPDPVYVRSYRINKALIKAIADYCKARRIRFLLVCINNEAYRPDVERTLHRTDPTLDTNFYEDDLGRFARSAGIEYIDLERPMRRYLVETGRSPHWARWGYWGHWNYDGHKLVADILTKRLAPIVQASQSPRRAY